jgi:hypothetical protein
MSPNKTAERSCVREPGVTGKRQAIERSLSSLLSARATRVGDYDRNEAEISRVPNRRFNANLHCYSGYRNRGDAAVPQCEGERGAFEC